MPITCTTTDGIAEIVMENPPVNALTVAGWFELAEVILAAGRDQSVGAVVLRAEGKGFNAGVDIKEMQHTEGFDALLGANRGCYAAFAAVYECEVPVIAAVHDFCLGGGIGLVGNADVIVAAEGTRFGLPEVNQGALENSNVKVIEEMVNLITTQRAYEVNTKAIQASDEMLSQANQLRR